jgi:hypothetical protein
LVSASVTESGEFALAAGRAEQRQIAWRLALQNSQAISDDSSVSQVRDAGVVAEGQAAWRVATSMARIGDALAIESADRSGRRRWPD